MLRVQSWLDSLAEKDAAEALRLWLAKQGVKTRKELLLGLIKGPQATVLPKPAGSEPIPEIPSPLLQDEELLR